MSNTTKQASKLDFEQVIKSASTDELATIATSGFVQSKVGHKIQKTIIDSVTDDYSYYNGAVLLMTLRIIYDDSTKATVLSAERTA
jgi:hypothetical protein